MMVVLQHAMPALASAGLRSGLAPFEPGSIAVLLFFVLSGFIVTDAAALFYERRAPEFLLNRMIRIYPPYAVAVALTVLVTSAVQALGGNEAITALFGTAPDHSVHNILASLAGILPVAGKGLEPAGSGPILILAWALRIELVFYGVVFLALAAGRLIDQPAARLLAVAGILVLGFDALRFEHLRGSGLEFTPYFVLGASIYFAITPASRRRRVLAAALVLISSVMIGVHIFGQAPVNEVAGFVRDLSGQCELFYTGIAVWLALMVMPRTVPSRIQALDQMLGELTYPLYLTHMAALLPCVWLVPRGSAMAWPLALAATLAMAWAMHRLLETRLMAVRRRVRGHALTVQRAGPVPMTQRPNQTAA